jgi:hypothetical protein
MHRFTGECDLQHILPFFCRRCSPQPVQQSSDCRLSLIYDINLKQCTIGFGMADVDSKEDLIDNPQSDSVHKTSSI